MNLSETFDALQVSQVSQDSDARDKIWAFRPRIRTEYSCDHSAGRCCKAASLMAFMPGGSGGNAAGGNGTPGSENNPSPFGNFNLQQIQVDLWT